MLAIGDLSKHPAQHFRQISNPCQSWANVFHGILGRRTVWPCTFLLTQKRCIVSHPVCIGSNSAVLVHVGPNHMHVCLAVGLFNCFLTDAETIVPHPMHTASKSASICCAVRQCSPTLSLLLRDDAWCSLLLWIRDDGLCPIWSVFC